MLPWVRNTADGKDTANGGKNWERQREDVLKEEGSSWFWGPDMSWECIIAITLNNLREKGVPAVKSYESVGASVALSPMALKKPCTAPEAAVDLPNSCMDLQRVIWTDHESNDLATRINLWVNLNKVSSPLLHPKANRSRVSHYTRSTCKTSALSCAAPMPFVLATNLAKSLELTKGFGITVILLRI